MGVSWDWKWVIVKLVFLRKPDAEPKKVIKSYCHHSHASIVEGVRDMHHSAIGKRKMNSRCAKQLHVGGFDVISCLHLE